MTSATLTGNCREEVITDDGGFAGTLPSCIAGVFTTFGVEGDFGGGVEMPDAITDEDDFGGGIESPDSIVDVFGTLVLFRREIEALAAITDFPDVEDVAGGIGACCNIAFF